MHFSLLRPFESILPIQVLLAESHYCSRWFPFTWLVPPWWDVQKEKQEAHVAFPRRKLPPPG